MSELSLQKEIDDSQEEKQKYRDFLWKQGYRKLALGVSSKTATEDEGEDEGDQSEAK